eukprot:2844325-Prymnesium_polylepis.1
MHGTQILLGPARSAAARPREPFGGCAHLLILPSPSITRFIAYVYSWNACFFFAGVDSSTSRHVYLCGSGSGGGDGCGGRGGDGSSCGGA